MLILEKEKRFIDGRMFSENSCTTKENNRNIEGPEMLKFEVKSTMAKLRRNKAMGPDRIVIMMLAALDALIYYYLAKKILTI